MVHCCGTFACRFSDHLEKCSDFRSQRAMARMNYVETAAQWFRIKDFHRGQFVAADFVYDGHLWKESKSQPAFDHALGGFD